MTTTTGLHEYIVQNLVGEAIAEATHLAFGDDNTAPDVQNETLNNEVERFELTSRSDEGRDLRTQTFLGAGDANGESLLECGLTDTDDEINFRLFNHSLIPDPEGRLDPKTDDVEAVITVTLKARDVSE